MKQLACRSCGAHEFFEQDGYQVCQYCGARYVMEPEDTPRKSMGMALSDDISALLTKCRLDPANARRYANLILDMDPGNIEAKKYIK